MNILLSLFLIELCTLFEPRGWDARSSYSAASLSPDGQENSVPSKRAKDATAQRPDDRKNELGKVVRSVVNGQQSARSAPYVDSYGAEMVPLVEPYLEDKDPNVRDRALELLQRVGGERAFQAVLQALKDPTPQVQSRAVSILTYETPQEQLQKFPDSLLPVLLEDSRRRSIGPMLLLGRLGRTSVIPDLREIKAHLRVIRRERWISRTMMYPGEAARMALAKLGDNTAREEIRQLLRDKYLPNIVAGIESTEYVGREFADETAKELTSLLEDKRLGVDIGPAEAPLVRVCDYDAWVLNRIYGLRLPLDPFQEGGLSDELLKGVKEAVLRAAGSGEQNGGKDRP